MNSLAQQCISRVSPFLGSHKSFRVSINVSVPDVIQFPRRMREYTYIRSSRFATGGRFNAGGPPRWLRRSGLVGSSRDSVVLARGHQGAILHHQPAAGRRREVRRRFLRVPVDERPVAVQLHQELHPLGVRA